MIESKGIIWGDAYSEDVHSLDFNHGSSLSIFSFFGGC